jgi:hypothetical protein
MIVNDYEPRHIIVTGSNGVAQVAKAFYGENFEVLSANARLISAAPELLEQLVLLVKKAEERGESCHEAKAAISKAAQ